MRHIILTGAGRGIGRATALALAAEGPARFILIARSAEQLDETAALLVEVGSEAVALVADLSDLEHVEATSGTALAMLDGRVDLLINNAGTFDTRPLEQTELAFWQHMLDVNLSAPMLLCKHLLSGLLASATEEREPAIVNVASVAAEQGFPGNSAYCASKYGLKGLSDALRAELAPRGIAVRTVYPGATDTTIFDDVEGDWDRSTMARPEHVAAVIARAAAAGSPDDLRLD